jgi:glycosyltransferase involved in cell wall biosynthesis
MSDMVVSVSEDAARVALDVELVAPDRVCVIHNGVELGKPLPPAAWESWRPRGITVARLDPVKDQRTMLAAVRGVVDACPDFRLDIVGDGSERKSLEKTSEDLGLAGHVRFLGYRKDVHQLLRRPQVFLSSSVTEGVSLTLLEAMAAGLPVVATDVGGNREVVVDGTTGLLVSPSSPNTMASQILSLVRDPARALAFGTAGRLRVETSFDLRRTVVRYQELYLRLVNRRGVIDEE